MAGSLFVADGVLGVIAIVLWMSASIVSVTYWYEGWRNSLKYSNPKVTKFTTIALIVVMSILLILGLVGILYIRTLAPYGNYVYLAPLIALTLTLIIVTIMITRSIDVKELPVQFVELHDWEVGLFVPLGVTWAIYCITLANYRNLYDPAIMLALVVFRLCEISISVILMLIVDYRAVSLRRVLTCRPDLGENKSSKNSRTDFVSVGTASTEPSPV